MRTRVFCAVAISFVLLLCVILKVGSSHRRHKLQGFSKETVTAANGSPVGVKPSARMATETVSSVPVRGADNSDQFVSLERAKRDPQYKKKIDYHTHIKEYLATPAKGTAVFEETLGVLLENGYSLSQLHNSYLALYVYNRRPDLNKVRTRVSVVNGIEVTGERYAARMRESFKRGITALSGVDDPKTIDQLAKISDQGEVPSYPMRIFDAQEGDRILGDEDWMNPEHRKAASAYTGPPRVVSLEVKDPAYGVAPEIEVLKP
jgi:hypothetical protein